MKKFLAAAVISFSCMTSAWASGGLMGAGQIQNMQSAYSGWLIFMTGTNANPDACPINIAILSPTGPAEAAAQYKELLAVIWSSQLAKAQINIYVAGCHPAGYKQVYFVITG